MVLAHDIAYQKSWPTDHGSPAGMQVGRVPSPVPSNGSEPNQADKKNSSTNPATGCRNTVPPQPLWVI